MVYGLFDIDFIPDVHASINIIRHFLLSRCISYYKYITFFYFNHMYCFRWNSETLKTTFIDGICQKNKEMVTAHKTDFQHLLRTIKREFQHLPPSFLYIRHFCVINRNHRLGKEELNKLKKLISEAWTIIIESYVVR